MLKQIKGYSNEERGQTKQKEKITVAMILLTSTNQYVYILGHEEADTRKTDNVQV